MPEQWRGKRMWAIAGQFAGPQDEAEKLLAPMRALGPEFDLFQPMPYTVVQGLIDGANPYGRRNYWRAHNLDGFDDERTDTLLERSRDDAVAVQRDARRSTWPGRSRDVGEDDTALGGRQAPFSLHLNTMWEGADERRCEHRVDARLATEAFSPWISPGMALNFYTEVGDDEIADSFGARLERLSDGEAEVRPGEPVPAQPEHQAVSASRRPLRAVRGSQ